MIASFCICFFSGIEESPFLEIVFSQVNDCAWVAAGTHESKKTSAQEMWDLFWVLKFRWNKMMTFFFFKGSLWYKYGEWKVKNLIDVEMLFLLCSYFFCLNPTVMPCSGHSFCWNLGQTCRGYRIGPGILRKRCSARCPTLCSVAAATTVLLTMRLGWQISMWEVPTIDYPPGN